MAGPVPVVQIWATLTTVLLVVVTMSKHFKDLIDALPSIRKAFNYLHKYWFKDALFKKDLMAKIEKIEAQVNYNGGTSMRDALKRVEGNVSEMKDNMTTMKGIISYNRAIREVTDKCSDRMLFKVDPEGACTSINDAFLKLFGYAEGDVLEYGFENLVHEDDVKEMRDKWNMAINRKAKFIDEQRIIASNGVEHLCLVKGHPICEGDVLIEFYGTIDIL